MVFLGLMKHVVGSQQVVDLGLVSHWLFDEVRFGERVRRTRTDAALLHTGDFVS